MYIIYIYNIYIEIYIYILLQRPSISFEFQQQCASRKNRYISGTVMINDTKWTRFWFLRLKLCFETNSFKSSFCQSLQKIILYLPLK